MDKIFYLGFDLNVTEIPSNAFKTSDRHNLSHLTFLELSSTQNLTIKSNAFKNLENLGYLNFINTNFKKFENESLNFGANLVDKTLDVNVLRSNLTGDSFEPETFDGLIRPIVVVFSLNSSLNYFPEATFKSVFNNKNNAIGNYFQDSLLYCEDCRNFWLIRDNKQDQMNDVFCNTEKLFRLKIGLKNGPKMGINGFCQINIPAN